MNYFWKMTHFHARESGFFQEGGVFYLKNRFEHKVYNQSRPN